ncbi:MAG: two component transcriptional regulator, winged helix family [Firmicutes bacterium]|nr:two component transcriptional regulator, winged helix family [Bacillota bacterium]
MKVLVTEDDEMLRKSIADALRKEGYTVDETGQGDHCIFEVQKGIYDLLVLDILLPEVDGLEVIRRLRHQGNQIPILLVTAKDSVENRVLGLNTGADDYLVKPFSLAELTARSRALLRRKGYGPNHSSIAYKELVLDLEQKEGFYKSLALSLTTKEFDLLEFFIINRERILTREQIFDRLWGFETESSYGIVDVYIHHLRKKLVAARNDFIIRTIRNVGYMLKGHSGRE